MDDRISEQLDKILALADSNHDGEALVAVRKAREMLLRDGLCFGDLAKAASIKASGAYPFLTGGRQHLESQVQHLRQQVEDLQAQMQTQDFQLDFWRRRAFDIEQSLQHAQSEAERWKKLATETANRLWDIARNMAAENFHSPEQAPESISMAKVAERK
ncbi:MAG: hypothetical protein PHW76_10260 [Alphaproteobacteria bacterium]|nr:hypothetical protein [Alphaproteobacteria bacterium]